MSYDVIVLPFYWLKFYFPENDFTVFAPTDAAFAQYRNQILRPHDPAEEEHYQGI